MKVTVEHEFWRVFPEAQISVLVVKGLDNSVDESKDPYFKSLLDKGAKRADDFIPDENFTQNEVIQEETDEIENKNENLKIEEEIAKVKETKNKQVWKL